MTPYRLRSLIALFALACFLLMAWSVPAEAQKKQKKTQQKVQQKETPKEEEQKEEQKEEQQAPAAAEPTVAPAPASSNLPGKLLDVLKQHVGEKTNLGTLRKIAGDYLVLEDEGVTMLVPFTAVQALKLVKDDESSPAHLEIKLIAKD